MGGKINLIHQPSASFQAIHSYGCKAGRLLGTTECDSREVKNWCHLISSHPPTSFARLVCLGRTQQRTLPSAFVATPRSWSGAKESGDRQRSISCTSPAMVFHRQTSWPRANRQDYWAGHRNMWSNLPLPLLHTRHTGPSRSFPALHTSSLPGLSCVCQSSSPFATSR